MLCPFNLFPIVFSGLFYKTVKQQYPLGLHNIVVVYCEKGHTILAACRYSKFIEIRINQFFDNLGIYDLHLRNNIKQIFDLLLNIRRQ